LKRVIHKLPKKQRDVFVLKEYGDLSYREIAKTLKIELGTVMSRLNRARQAVKKQFTGDKNV
jgi:RNA polymerase sigma-70 factor (ECF subfamily)